MNIALIGSLSAITNKISLSHFTGAIHVAALARVVSVKTGKQLFIYSY